VVESMKITAVEGCYRSITPNKASCEANAGLRYSEMF
jgi:hypothetical protein